MSLLDDFRGIATELIAEFGSPAVLTVPNAIGAASGEVEEAPVDYALPVAGPIDEAARWQQLTTDVRVTATFYAAADGLAAVVPAPGHRITYQGRKFIVAAVTTYGLQGGNVAFRLDCGEVGRDG